MKKQIILIISISLCVFFMPAAFSKATDVNCNYAKQNTSSAKWQRLLASLSGKAPRGKTYKRLNKKPKQDSTGQK